MPKMNALMFDRFGPPAEVLKRGESPRPEPGAGEVLVRTILSPMHNHDVLIVRGEYGDLPELPAIGGTEAVGVVEALGAGVTGLKKGQRVAIAGIGRTWADYFVAPAAAAVPLPDAVSDEIGAQLIAMPSSSVMALNAIGAKRGDWIVINAANGAVGKSLAQIAQARGVRVASIVNRSEVIDAMEKIGIGPVFAMDKKDWKDAARKAIGDGKVAGGAEMIGGTAASDLVNLVSENGKVLSFGAMSSKPMVIDQSDLIYRNITVAGFWGLREHKASTPADTRRIAEELIGLAANGALDLPVEKIYRFDEANKAGKAYYERRNGKIMFQP